MHDAGSLPFDCNAALNNFFRAAWLETSKLSILRSWVAGEVAFLMSLL